MQLMKVWGFFYDVFKVLNKDSKEHPYNLYPIIIDFCLQSVFI